MRSDKDSKQNYKKNKNKIQPVIKNDIGESKVHEGGQN